MIWERMSATGNSFFVFDELRGQRAPPQEHRAALAKLMCQQFVNYPTDGMLILQPVQGADFRWDFYNADGSHAEMCGNAARCAALYYSERINSQSKIRFLSGAGPVMADLLGGGQVQVTMPPIERPVEKIEGHYFVNTGVPHIVVDQAPDVLMAQRLRKNNANVTFVTEIKNKKCVAVTFERGVENFTSACGTGAVAAAAFMAEQRLGELGSAAGDAAGAEYEVEMPGGILQVFYRGTGNQPSLTGPAQFDYEIEIFSGVI